MTENDEVVESERWGYTDEEYEKLSKALDECPDLTRMPRELWDFIMDTYDRLAVPNPDKMTDDQKKLKWELACAEGNDWKYGRMMICREKKIVRNLTFDEFCGGVIALAEAYSSAVLKEMAKADTMGDIDDIFSEDEYAFMTEQHMEEAKELGERRQKKMKEEKRKNEPWYGFDLDGTLAEYHGWQGEDHIGAPVAPIVRLITAMHRAGLRVKVMTARVAPKDKINTFPNPYIKECMTIQDPPRQTWALKDRWTAREFVQEWCYRNLGFVPEITHEKDYHMLQLFDDRCVQIETNTGKILGRMPEGLAMPQRD